MYVKNIKIMIDRIYYRSKVTCMLNLLLKDIIIGLLPDKLHNYNIEYIYFNNIQYDKLEDTLVLDISENEEKESIKCPINRNSDDLYYIYGPKVPITESMKNFEITINPNAQVYIRFLTQSLPVILRDKKLITMDEYIYLEKYASISNSYIVYIFNYWLGKLKPDLDVIYPCYASVLLESFKYIKKSSIKFNNFYNEIIILAKNKSKQLATFNQYIDFLNKMYDLSLDTDVVRNKLISTIEENKLSLDPRYTHDLVKEVINIVNTFLPIDSSQWDISCMLLAYNFLIFFLIR